MATTKLLANTDRWADDDVFSRDLIDLAMLQAPKNVFAQAIRKARIAYGDAVDRSLGKAIIQLRDRPGRLDECMDALKMTGVPKALLWKRIRALHPAAPKKS